MRNSASSVRCSLLHVLRTIAHPAVMATVIAGTSQLAQAQGQLQAQGQNQLQGQQKAAPAQQPPAQPFHLTPHQEAELNQMLIAWENRSQGIKTFRSKFKRWEYDLVFGPPNKHMTESGGELKYATPDKGLFHVTETKVWNGMKGQYEDSQFEQNEQWICDGKVIFQFDPAVKQVKEYKLPPELQGKAISNGPLPFLFGAKAAALKDRYFMRLVTPADDKDHIWLQALPRYQNDAANFSQATLMLSKQNFLPEALQIMDPGDKKRTVYKFYEIVENRVGFFERDFSVPRIPFGWKKVSEQVPQAAANQQPGAAPQAQAQRPANAQR